MCYRAYVQTTRTASSDEAAPAPTTQLRPRWVAAAVAVLAVTAVAALLPAVPEAAADQPGGATRQVDSTLVQPVSIDKAGAASLPADDGVPTNASANAMAAGHDCHHGL